MKIGSIFDGVSGVLEISEQELASFTQLTRLSREDLKARWGVSVRTVNHRRKRTDPIPGECLDVDAVKSPIKPR
jgi:hypothetical protein